MWRFDSLRVSKRLSEQEEAMASVQRRLTALEVQWSDTLDRLKQMMGRILKERARSEAALANLPQQDREPHLADEDVANGQQTASGWTPGQLTAQQRILARRNRMGRGSEQ